MGTIKWCRWSERGIAHCNPRKPFRIGRLLRKGYSQPRSWHNGHPYAIVLWNGLRCPQQLHEDFVIVFAQSNEDDVAHIPQLPVFAHLLRSFAWR